LAASAQAAPVLVMGKDGKVRQHANSLAPAATFPAPRPARTQRQTASARQPLATAARKRRTVTGELSRLFRAGAIDEVTYAERRAAWSDARRTAKRLKGARKTELGSVIRTIQDIANRRQLIPSRLAPLWLTLERNRQWWTAGPLLSSGRRVGFEGSQIVWQYYPGNGIQIQVLGTFGKLNGLWSSRQNDALSAAVDELIPLAAERAGGLAWEYYFPYRAGPAPWVSSLAQGTALQALARAAQRLRRRADIIPIASRGLGIFERDAPDGVRVPMSDGSAHYAQYSFEPQLRILNGFTQSLVGLFDYAKLAPDERARLLYEAGERRLRAEVPTYDTGAWSLYSRGSVEHESSLSYHELLRDFLDSLCDRTADALYCGTRDHFTAYLDQPPLLTLRTTRLRGGRYGYIKLDLSKISNVTLRILRDGETVHSRYVGTLGHGRRELGWSVPRKAGLYTVQLAARDLAGNPAGAEGDVQVLKPRKKKRKAG
jgi:hypothetical protein